MPTILLLLLTLLPSTPLLAEPAVNEQGQITLQHRPAEELIPLLSPFLAEGERAGGEAGRLILSAPRGRLQSLASIAQSLDQPRHALRITLHRGTPPAPGVRRLQTKGKRARDITTLEGETVEIFSGRRETVLRKGIQGIHARGVELEERERGERVRLRVWLVQDQAIIELRRDDERRASGADRVERMESRVRATTGEWLRLGGRDGDRRREGRRFTSTGDDSLWLRVERLN